VIGCIVQARMSSTRLPGKVLKNIDDKNTLLNYVLFQLKESKLIEKIVIATSTLSEDDVIADFAKNENIDCYRGNLNNVLDRFYNCAKIFSFSKIVRITADNPLIDPTIIDKVIEKFESDDSDYASNCTERTFPNGTEVEIFSFNSLENAWLNSKDEYEQEHVTPYFYKNPNHFKISVLKNSIDLSNFKWTVDTLDDFLFVQKIILKINKRPILISDILKIINDIQI